MRAIGIAGANKTFGAPAGWDSERHGVCASVEVRVNQGVHQTAWKPSEEDLAILKAGGHIVLSVVGSQPVVALETAPASEAVEIAVVPGETICNEFMKITTALIAHWSERPVDVKARIQGAVYSVLSLIDGRHTSIPAMRLVTAHGQVLNDGVMLGDLVWVHDEVANG